MFFVIIFLALVLSGANFFPDTSWAILMSASLLSVLALRLLIHLTERSHTNQDQEKPQK